MQSPPPASSERPDIDVPETKTWRVGTLVYTTGGLVAVFAWLLWGDFAWQIRDRSVLPVTQLLLKNHQASDFLIALLFGSLPMGLGLVTGPVISYMSDRHRGRLGRRIPFLIATTPFVVLSIIGMATAPVLAGVVQRASRGLIDENTAVLVVMGSFLVLFEFACNVANMIFGGLVNDVVPQKLLGRFFGLFRIVSLVAGIIFNYWFIGHAEKHYVLMFTGVAIVYAVGFGMLCWKVREGEYPPPSKAVEGPRLAKALEATKTYFKDGYGNPFYLWFFAVTILSALALTPSNLYNLYYAKSLGMDMAGYGKAMSYSFMVSLVLAYPLGYLADRLHPLRMTMAAVFLYMLVMLASALFATNARILGFSLIAQSILAGCYYTVSLSLPQRLLPKDRFASIGSAGGTISCLLGIAFAPGLGLLLDASGHHYIYAYYVSFILAALAFVSCCVLHKKFTALGGVKSFVAP